MPTAEATVTTEQPSSKPFNPEERFDKLDASYHKKQLGLHLAEQAMGMVDAGEALRITRCWGTQYANKLSGIDVPCTAEGEEVANVHIGDINYAPSGGLAKAAVSAAVPSQAPATSNDIPPGLNVPKAAMAFVIASALGGGGLLGGLLGHVLTKPATTIVNPPAATQPAGIDTTTEYDLRLVP